MAEFLIEAYLSKADEGAEKNDAQRLRWAAEQLMREGVRVRFLRSIFVPEDETCFYLYEAASAEDVREAVRRAELPSAHVSEAVATPKEDER